MQTLDQQLERLIQDAPNDDVTATLLRAIAPLLLQMARQLKHAEYHVLQGRDAGWLVTTLSNRTQPELEKSVIYAFSTHEDAQNRVVRNREAQIAVSPVPVIHLLFQLIALRAVESAIFFEVPGDSHSGIEVSCRDLRQRVQALLAAHHAQSRSIRSRSAPPDIA